MSDKLLKQSNARCFFRQTFLQKCIHFTLILHFLGLKLKIIISVKETIFNDLELLVVWLRVVLLFCDDVEFIRLCLTEYSETFKEFNIDLKFINIWNFLWPNIMIELEFIKITLNSGTCVG